MSGSLRVSNYSNAVRKLASISSSARTLILSQDKFDNIAGVQSKVSIVVIKCLPSKPLLFFASVR